jgi:topoisomerase IV subunit A
MINEEQVFENTNNETTGVTDLYKGWFLDYASYVILERAVPAVEDGLKPVQRRILHAMKEMDDGRFNKVANIVGQSMQYHPHGDASITDAMVNMGQKELLIETQGNWGDFRTGDEAAAPRYIEARLSKLALEIAFNAKTTNWTVSYDGRKKEPVTLPMKFPLGLAHGAEGIAVGLSTKIMPHNFNELCDASVKYLRGRKFELYPDFMTEGLVDCSNYNDGRRGGKIRVRSRIEELDKKTLVIKDVPYGVTVSSLCDSITKASEQGKIKIKKVTDVTAAEIAIYVELAPGISPDITIDALYAFTDCEISISPNACVIQDEKPVFTSVSDLLRRSTDHTKDLLQRELEIKLAELNDKWHNTSLEKIFFEEKIYKELERKIETWERVLEAIDKAFVPFKKRLRRDITREDILKLTEKPVRRIYKLDIDELNNQIQAIEAEIKSVEYDLANLVEFTIKYFQNLQAKFGKGRERRTEVRAFDVIEARHVAIANTKVYMNRAEGFIGSGLKKDEFIAECSTLDDIIAFTKSGKMKIVRVADKAFIGKDIMYAAVFQKGDERTTYNMVYADGKSGICYVKRFNVNGITRDKEYDLTQGTERSKILYLTANPNGEAETVRVILSPNATARVKEFDYSFEELEIKIRSAKGNQLSKYPVKQVKFKEAGRSTLAGRKLWYDDQFGRISTEEKNTYLGMFDGDDKIIAFYANGTYEIVGQEITQRFETEQLRLIERFDPEKVVTAVYYDHDKLQYNIKRFRIETTTMNTPFNIIREGENNYLELVTTEPNPVIKLTTGKKAEAKEQIMKVAQFIDITGQRTIGTRLVDKKNVTMEWVMKEKKKADDGQGQLF